jgi:quercetin 2,3-dioxygenase
MSEHNRRDFLRIAGLAGGSGLIAYQAAAAIPGLTQTVTDAPAEILHPVEVTGPLAVPIVGHLPGSRRQYMLPAGQGENHTIGSHVMTRLSRPAETTNVHELVAFAAKSGASMPRHAHLGAHAALLVLGGIVELELNGDTWTMMRGDFANIPPGTPHAWTMRSDKSQFALYTMGDRVGAAFVAMGTPAATSAVPQYDGQAIAPGRLVDASVSGDFQLRPSPAPASPAARVANKTVPGAPGPYVILDGGGDRFGGNTLLAKNVNTGGQFLFVITDGPKSPGVGPHFHARHFENFLGIDGETMGWAHGKAVSVKTGDYFQTPPLNLHGFALTQPYNRFAAFLTPGIFEKYFTGNPFGRLLHRPGADAQNGVPDAGGVAVAAPGPPPGTKSTDSAMLYYLMMSGRGPDGFPLDVHAATRPLPPQDPFWINLQPLTVGRATSAAERMALLTHGMAICGVAGLGREMSPELRRSLTLKPKAENFV